MILHLALSGVEPSSLWTQTTLHIFKNPILQLSISLTYYTVTQSVSLSVVFFHGEHPLSTITGGLQNQLTNYSCFRPRILLLIAEHGVSQITLNWLVRSALLDILQIGFSIKAVAYDTNFIDSLTSLVMLQGVEP